jgi:FKBP-type peptidyl-prolyl cis-trans isomerase FklB
MMREGEKALLYIPSNLAYGEWGAGPAIGPNEVIVFEVELFSIIGPPDP